MSKVIALFGLMLILAACSNATSPRGPQPLLPPNLNPHGDCYQADCDGGVIDQPVTVPDDEGGVSRPEPAPGNGNHGNRPHRPGNGSNRPQPHPGNGQNSGNLPTPQPPANTPAPTATPCQCPPPSQPCPPPPTATPVSTPVPVPPPPTATPGQPVPVPTPTPTPIPTPEEIKQSVYFSFDSAELTDDEEGNLTELLFTLEGLQNRIVVRIKGYSDRIGSSDYNYDLSYKRAVAVKDYLVSRSAEVLRSPISETRFQVIPEGEADPVTNCPDTLSRRELIDCLAPDRRASIVISVNSTSRRVSVRHP